MIKSILFLISLLFMLPCMSASSVTSGSSCTHPHTNALELKPASLLGSYQTASVCFMGFGDCDPNAAFGKGDDYSPDIATKCTNEGYFLNNCGPLQSPTQYCPESNAFIKGCKCRDDLISCGEGQQGVGNSCGNKYASCQCIPGVAVGTYGCKTYYPAPCNSSCKIANIDNCHIRNDINIPTDASCSATFLDCTSKCSKWTCNSGYVQSESSCVQEACPYGYDTSVKSCSLGYTLKTNGTSKGQVYGKCEVAPCPAGYYNHCSSFEDYDVTSGYSGGYSCKHCRLKTCDEVYWPNKGVTDPSSCGRGRFWVDSAPFKYMGSGKCGSCAETPCPDNSDVDRLNFLCGPGYVKTVVGYTGDRACYKCIKQ